MQKREESRWSPFLQWVHALLMLMCFEREAGGERNANESWLR
jgi:hypothetical protein